MAQKIALQQCSEPCIVSDAKQKSGTMSLTIRERSQKVAGYIKTET
ncbi:hypothetical protein Lepto7375DRAFT_8449, partial [Leptolyngbya sp. PCC 7375]